MFCFSFICSTFLISRIVSFLIFSTFLSFAAMRDHGTFPTHILEKFVKRDIDKQM